MRLSKRIAIGVMAAALALSMTACGGDVPEQPSNSGADGTNTSTGSNTSTGTDTDDKKDETTTTPPKEDNKDNGIKDKVPNETRAQNFFSGRYIMNISKWTYTVLRTDVRAGGQIVSNDVAEIVARDGRRWVFKCKDGNFIITQLQDGKEGRRYEIINDSDHDWTEVEITNNINYQEAYGYLGEDILWKGDNTYQTLTRFKRANKYEVGTREIGGVTYYSETYTFNYPESTQYEENIYCFDSGDIEGRYLRYYIRLLKNSNGEIEGGVINKITGLSNTFDEGLLQVPEGYDISVRNAGESEYVSTGEKTTKDTYPN